MSTYEKAREKFIQLAVKRAHENDIRYKPSEMRELLESIAHEQGGDILAIWQHAAISSKLFSSLSTEVMLTATDMHPDDQAGTSEDG
jgi:predicted Zn-dependent protease